MNIARTALRGVTFHNPSKASDGYVLFGPYGYSAFGTACSDVWLIDKEGHILHRWRLPHQPGLHAILLDNGHLLYPVNKGESGWNQSSSRFFGFAQSGDEFQELDWDGNLVWKAPCRYQNHDFLVLPNGHIMYPTYGDPDGILPDELAARWKGGRPGTELDGKIYGDNIYEIDRDGKIVWEWISYEHLDPEIDTICPLEDRTHWHINSLWFCRDGGILASPRWLNEVFKIDYPSGKVIARYGKGKIFHQHDVRELDNGDILVFDNGSHRHSYEPTYSRVVEIDPKTDEIVWEYKADLPSDFYSAVCAGSERLPNGNTLICESELGRIFEVTYEGELVWEYVSPFMGWKWCDVNQIIYGGKMFRAHHYPRDYPGLKGKDLDPAKHPWENRIFGPEAFNRDFVPHIF